MLVLNFCALSLCDGGWPWTDTEYAVHSELSVDQRAKWAVHRAAKKEAAAAHGVSAETETAAAAVAVEAVSVHPVIRRRVWIHDDLAEHIDCVWDCRGCHSGLCGQNQMEWLSRTGGHQQTLCLEARTQ